MNFLICGFGYTTQYFVKYFAKNYKILTRKIDEIPKEYLYTEDSKFFPDIVIDSIPPVWNQKQEMINPIYKEILLNLWNKKKFVYIHISSTSIYPEEGEFTELSSIPYWNERGKLRWDLEEKILEVFPYALIVRAGGIYGKERNLVVSLKKGDYRMLPDSNRIVARIHVYDLCQILFRAGEKLFDAGIQVSLFKGHKRKNLILAVEPKGIPQQEILNYIENQFKIQIPITLLPAKKNRVIKSLYAESLIHFQYPDIFSGLKDLE